MGKKTKQPTKPNKPDYIREYHKEMNDGGVLTGHWIQILYDRIVNGLNSGEYIYCEDKAEAAIEWIEKHCFHTEGPLAPGNLKLELWQKALIACIFGIVDKDGKRQFREVVLIVSRKNGKSLLAAAIARYEWLIDGGYGARIYCLAPKLDQAEIIYNDIWQMTQVDPEWVAMKDDIEARRQNRERVDDSDLPRHRMTDLFFPATNSTVKKIAFSAKKSDGFNPSLTVCDEIASWQGDQGLKQYEVLKSGMGARPEGLMLSCSTAGYINDGIYDELIKRSTRFLMGDSKEKRLLPFLYMIDDVEKWNDINELKKSNPNMGVSVSQEYLLEEIAIAEGSLSKKAEFITKYCNVKQNSTIAWLTTETVERCCGEKLNIEDFRHSYAVCGIDLSQTTDLTAVCMVVEKNGELFVFSHFFMPESRLENATAEDGVPYRIFLQQGFLSLSGENYVDYHDCFNWILRMTKQHEILPLVIGYDRYSAQYLIDDLKQSGFNCDDVYQGHNLSPVIREMEGILKDGKLHIGDNNLLKSHLLNAALKQDQETQKVKMVKSGIRTRVDGTAALLDAMCVRQKWNGELGDQLKNKR